MGIHNCTFIYQSTLNGKGLKYANTLMDPTNYDKFYLEYLETSLMRYTGKMQIPVGPVGADFTIRSMTCG